MRLLALIHALLLWAATVAAQEIVMTFGGDVNFAHSHQTPQPRHVSKFKRFTLDVTTQVLAEEWTGDVNFVSAEMVVSETDGAPQWGERFVFRSHPA